MAKKTSTASNDKKREAALDLYLNTDLDQKAICEIVGWAENTFTRYKTEENWGALRVANGITKPKIIAKLLAKMEMQIEADTLDADQIAKIGITIDRLSDGKASISNYFNMFKEFMEFAMAKDLELAKEINRLQNEFITRKMNG